jgi:hypothetical protein
MSVLRFFACMNSGTAAATVTTPAASTKKRRKAVWNMVQYHGNLGNGTKAQRRRMPKTRELLEDRQYSVYTRG